MQCTGVGHAGHLDFAMQHAAALEGVGGNVLVFPRQDLVARQDGVAVVAGVVDAVLAVGEVGVDMAREELGLRPARPVLKAAGAQAVAALHFLQEHDVGAQGAEAVAQFVHGQAPVELRQAFVDVVTGNVQRRSHGANYKRVGSRRMAAALLGEKQFSAACAHGSQRQPHMFVRRQHDRQGCGQPEAEDVLGVVRHPGGIAVAPAIIDFVAVFDAPLREIELRGVEPGFLAHFANRGLLQRFAGILRAGDRLPEARRIGALHQQHLAVGRVNQHQHRYGQLECA